MSAGGNLPGPGRGLLTEVLTLGWLLPSALAAGAGLGYLLDRWLGSAPWGLGIGVALGAFAGIRELLRKARVIGNEKP